jgi:hypothetical protein
VTLRALLEAAAEDLDDVEAVQGSGGVEWRRGGRPFATVSDDVAEFQLDGPVASAAVRTPDTQASKRGPDWVRFSPSALDRYAQDRARAWLAFAWRCVGD